MKLVRKAILASASLLALVIAGPALADPIITPLIAAGAAAAFGEGAAAVLGTTIIGSVTVGSAISTALLGGALLGAEALLNRPRGQQPSFQLPAGPVPVETQAQAIRDRFFSYGIDRIGGTYAFRESSGNKLGYGIILNCRPIDAAIGLYVDDELLALQTGPCSQGYTNPQTGVPGITTVDYGPSVSWPNGGLKWALIYSYYYSYDSKTKTGTQVPIVLGAGPVGFLEFRNATDAGVASTLLTTTFPSLWTTAHAARGLSMLYSQWSAVAVTGGREAHFPRFFPVHSTVIRGNRVYDPRDATQSFNDPVAGAYSVYNATWKYSDNPALCIADYLTFPEGGNKPYSRIDWNSMAMAANACDAQVDAYGNTTEPFARVNCTWGTSEEPRDVLNRMKAAADAEIYETPAGLIGIRIIGWEDPTVFLTAADISSVEITESDGVYAETNYIAPTFVEPRTNFTKNTAVTITDDASIAQVGERRGTMDFTCVHSHSQAYRLATRVLRRQNTPQKLTITGGPRLLLADGERVVGINAPEYGLVGTYRITSLVAPTLASVTIGLSLVTSDMFANVVPPYDPVNPSLPGVPVNVGYAPSQAVLANTAGSVSGTTGTLTASVVPPPSATPPVNDTTSVAYFRSRSVDPTTLAPLADWTVWTDALGQYAADFSPITDNGGSTQVFEIEAWFVSNLGIAGPMSASAFVTLSFSTTLDRTGVTLDSTTRTLDSN